MCLFLYFNNYKKVGISCDFDRLVTHKIDQSLNFIIIMGACARVISGMAGKKMCFFGFWDLFLCVDFSRCSYFGQFLPLKRENNFSLSLSLLLFLIL